MTTFGLLGLGEAGAALAAGLRTGGHTDLIGYDIAADTSGLVQQRARDHQVRLVASAEELGRQAEVIISAVVCTEAPAAAASVAPVLGPDQWFLDINSVGPQVKERIGRSLGDQGARYVDIAVMSNISRDLVTLPLLAAGPDAEQVAALFAPITLNLEVVSSTTGDAARIKMFRSLFVKGLEALALEGMLAAYHSGVHEEILASLDVTFGQQTFSEIVTHLLERHAVHGRRRAHELSEVAGTLSDSGIEPIMAEAGHRRMMWDVDRGLQEEFTGGTDPDWRQVLEALDRRRDGLPQ